MFEKTNLLYLYVETSLHAGSGSGLGLVDLPIQRERVTGYPIVQGSGLKGKLRAEADNRWPQPNVWAVFGPDTQQAAKHAGALAPGDARLLLFPVRSLLGIFAWTTAEDVLARFARDARLVEGMEMNWQPTGPSAEDVALVAPNSDVVATNQVVLEEFTFRAEPRQEVATLGEWLAEHALPQTDDYAYWRQKLPRNLVILPQNAFRDFTQFATEVVNRIRLESDRKTVEAGALWSEEHLPSDTLLYAPLHAQRVRVPEDMEQPEGIESAQDVLGAVSELVNELKRVQLGGDETVGRGLVRLVAEGGDIHA